MGTIVNKGIGRHKTRGTKGAIENGINENDKEKERVKDFT
jgi:hypothetical protein